MLLPPPTFASLYNSCSVTYSAFPFMFSRAPVRARDAEFRAHPTLGSNRPGFRNRVALWCKIRLLRVYRKFSSVMLIFHVKLFTSTGTQFVFVFYSRRPSVVQLLSGFLVLVLLVIVAFRTPVSGRESACSGPHCGNMPLKDSLIPLLQNPGYGSTWLAENQRQLQALFRCIELDLCGPNQAKGH